MQATKLLQLKKATVQDIEIVQDVSVSFSSIEACTHHILIHLCAYRCAGCKLALSQNLLRYSLSLFPQAHAIADSPIDSKLLC